MAESKRIARVCATFAPLPGAILTTITVRRASDGHVVAVWAPMDSAQLRYALPEAHAKYPRPDYTLELEVWLEQAEEAIP